MVQCRCSRWNNALQSFPGANDDRDPGYHQRRSSQDQKSANPRTLRSGRGYYCGEWSWCKSKPAQTAFCRGRLSGTRDTSFFAVYAGDRPQDDSCSLVRTGRIQYEYFTPSCTITKTMWHYHEQSTFG